MRLFGLDITRRNTRRKKSVEKSGVLAPVDNRGWQRFLGWVSEPFAGAWQAGQSTRMEDVLSYHAVYACITLIASDIGKLAIGIVKQNGKIWEPFTSPAFSPVLRKPNRYQNHIQFKEWWLTSKLTRGNTYVLKERDARGVVVALYILHPERVLPLVAPDGSIYYQLGQDNLSGLIDGAITVPASEIIHDRMNCLYHPLVGISPIYACGIAAQQGQAIQANSASFFRNMSQPGGMLTAPGSISDETAARLKAAWTTNYGGANVGKVAVAGDGLEFKPFAMSATDAQLIEQLKWTADVVCSVFHVPPYKIGVGDMPKNNNIEALQQEYYSAALQILVESMELCIDEGIALPPNYGVELDIDGLLRMDKATQMTTYGLGVQRGIMSPNNARQKLNMPPAPGGEQPYMQQQNFSLEALAKRDALDNPFVIDKPLQNPTPSSNGPAAEANPPPGPDNEEPSDPDEAKKYARSLIDRHDRRKLRALEKELGIAA